MPGDTVVMSGSLGSSQAGLAQWMLSGDPEIEAIIAAMQGHVRIVDDNGNVSYKRVGNAAYSEECIAWFQSCLLVVLGKNISLGRINTEAEKHELAWQMCRSFMFQVMANMKKYDLRACNIQWLIQQYRSYTIFALTHPLYGGMRQVLTSTTSESTQTVKQNITSSEEKRGLLGGIFGKGGS